MPETLRSGAILSRRRLLASASAAGALTLIGGMARPYLSRAADRPRITHGIQSGDTSAGGGIIWARADRPARMLVEASTTESFRNVVATASIDATADSDFTAKVLLERLPAGQDIFYRVAFADIGSPAIVGEHQVGRFRTAPDSPRSVSFAWSGDTVGCWGIDEARGGMRTYATLLRNRPDFFVHCGDNIYADCPLPRETALPNGEIWRNLVTEEKSRVAETLADYRGNYKYNLLDHNLRAFNAEIPVFAQWDDHEVTDDWYPGMPLHVAMPISRRWRRAAAAHFTSSPRHVNSRPNAAASIARSATARISMCSCSTCAAIADPIATASRTPTVLRRISSGRRR
jgi:alkaline phosphatase D